MSRFEFVAGKELKEHIEMTQACMSDKRILFFGLLLFPLIYFVLCSVIILFG